jgi:hypothetical protein
LLKVIVRLVGVLSHFIYFEDARKHKPKNGSSSWNLINARGPTTLVPFDLFLYAVLLHGSYISMYKEIFVL